MFDCLIARLYLQAIVLGDSDQSCVHIICLWVCVCTVHVWNLFFEEIVIRISSVAPVMLEIMPLFVLTAKMWLFEVIVYTLL